MKRNSGKRRRSTRKQSPIASIMICMAVLVVCGICIVKVTSLNAKSKELAGTEQILEHELELAEQEAEVLKAQAEYMKTKKYIEDVAKDKLGLVYPDEIVIRPKE